MKVAAVQMTSTPSVTENLAQAAALIAAAAAKEAKLTVLPEMFAIFGASDEELLTHQESLHHGPIQAFLSQQAKQHAMWIVGGTLPLRSPHSRKLRAASLVFDPQGHAVFHYDKMHLYDAILSASESYQESKLFEAGDRIVTAPTPFGTLGLAVCYDVRFPELFREMSAQHAEVFCLPAAFTVKTGQAHWELLARARAVENFCFVIGACQGGQHSSTRRTWGHSLIISPWGDVMAQQADDQPGVIVADIDLADLHRVRHMLPALAHRRLR